jgi:cell division transport system ATP-binding protein
MIHFEDVTKRYERQDALAGVSFHLAPGEMAFLTGHSGAGKSTLLRLVGLVERPTRGTLRVAGRDLAKLKRRDIPYHRRDVGMIFQDFRLLQDRTAFDNVALPLMVSGVSPTEIGRRARAALDKVGLLRKERSLPRALSGGEQQRVGIARAIVTKPPVIVADEPTGNLDPDLSWEIMDLFGQLNRVGVTLLIATHDWELVRRMHYRTLSLKHGKLADDTGRPGP